MKRAVYKLKYTGGNIIIDYHSASNSNGNLNSNYKARKYNNNYSSSTQNHSLEKRAMSINLKSVEGVIYRERLKKDKEDQFSEKDKKTRCISIKNNPFVYFIADYQ